MNKIGALTGTSSGAWCRDEDPSLLTGAGRYVANLEMSHAACVTYVTSSHPHARLRCVDVSVARAMPGVLGVFTTAEVDADLGAVPLDVPKAWSSEPWGSLPTTMPRHFLASDVVRYVGEPIVAIVSETEQQGADAAAEVVVDYEPLAVVVGAEQASTSDVHLFPDAGTNVCFEMPGPLLDVSGCDVVVRQRIENQRVAPCPLEGRSVASSWSTDGRLTHWASCQGAHPVRDRLAIIYGLATDAVRVIANDVGGGFGAKSAMYPEELLCPWLSARVGRAVRWTEHRTEGMLGLGHGRGQIQHVEIGGTMDGKVLAYGLSVVQDTGAYPRVAAILPILTRYMSTGPYVIPNRAFSATCVVTNTVPMVAYRGAGRPEASAAIERAIDLFAAAIGMDSVEVRRRNLVAPAMMPFTNAAGAQYDSGRYAEALELAVAAADFEAVRDEQRRAIDAGRRVVPGIGVGTYVEVTAFNGGAEYGSVEMMADGSATVSAGIASQGQGHRKVWATLVADRLHIDRGRIDVLAGDTELVRRGGLTAGSRGAQVCGSNLFDAAERVVAAAVDLVARMAEGDPGDVILDERGFHIAGTPSMQLTWGQVAQASYRLDGRPLRADGAAVQPDGTFSSGAHVAVVDVDVETGGVVLRGLIAVDDAGTILDERLAEGQIHGGLAQGAAQALMEGVTYDAAGNPLTTNLADYLMISAPELPPFRTMFMQSPTPRNRLGAKGVGESGVMGSTPAVQNAVIDALSHLGVRHIDMPLTPERVWQAISEATAVVGAPAKANR